MRCLGCDYELTGLTEHVCPECGAEFDPGVPETYRAGGRWSGARWVVVCGHAVAAGPLVWVGLVHVALIGARVSLGRWPNRFGADDPKDLTRIGRALYWLASVSVGLWPASVAGALVLLGVMHVRREGRRGWAVMGTLALSWGVAILIARRDPALALSWFAD